MELREGIETRRSIRKFTEELIPEDTMKEIVKLASYAPSWKNTQITRYTLVQDPDLINRIAQEATSGFQGNLNIISHAKNLVVVSYVKGKSGFEKDGSYTTVKKEQWQMFDAGIAVQTFCLAAHSYGIGSVIMGIFDEDKAAELIQLPEEETVAALVAIGNHEGTSAMPKRKEVEELLRIVR